MNEKTHVGGNSGSSMFSGFSDLPKDFRYFYLARITAVYDGDTVTADIDLGFNLVMHSQKLRLYGIDTPELRGAERDRGIIVRDDLRKRVLNKDVMLRTHKDKQGKYGRWLAELCDIDTGENLNKWLVDSGRAKMNFYK